MNPSVVVIVLLPLLAGCTDASRFFRQLHAEWNAALAVLQGKESPLAKKSHPRRDREVPGLREQRAQVIQEMIRVVERRAVADPRASLPLVDAWEAGATIEGLYRGRVWSSDYRAWEENSGLASRRVVQAFVQEALGFEECLGRPASWNDQSARPLARPTGLGESSGASGTEPLPLPAGRERRAALERVFSQASVFTLKRLLSELALECIEELERQGRLNDWYADWATRLAAEPGPGGAAVDFGLAQRNRSDVAFHRTWAREASLDRIHWEVLNRVHRILNELDPETEGPR
jgi:hypothetical protein